MKQYLESSVTAIILAGGSSRRMKKDKSTLLIDKLPMIEYVFNQLNNRFKEILISSNHSSKYEYLGVPVISNLMPNNGPLIGMVSAMLRSKSQINFVVACDIPKINFNFLELMVQNIRDYDGVIPINHAGRYEPLFALYKNNILAKMEELINRGMKKIISTFPHFNFHYQPLGDESWLKNLNYKSEYEEYLLSINTDP